METRLHRVYLGLHTPDGGHVDGHEATLYVAAYLKRVYDIDGMTVTNGIGYWKGQTEPVVIFEVVDDNSLPWEGLAGLATNLRNRYAQESVMVTKQSIVASFV